MAAPSGGGGGGGPVGFAGGAFTGPAQALEIIGNYGYAYSGSVQVADSEITLLEFTTGNYIFNGMFNFYKNNDDGQDFQYQVYMNDSVIIGFVEEYSANYRSQDSDIIIPPYTLIKATALSVGSGASTERPILCVLTGELER